MLAKIQKWGNSQGLRLNLQVLEKAQLKVGDEVEVSDQNGQIVITPAHRVRGRVNLKRLLEKVPQGQKSAELDWGGNVGKELEFDPQSGHEQMGRRPALVLSHTEFNKKCGLAVVCPISNTNRGYPFHVAVATPGKITGFVMVEHVKSVDYRARNAKKIARASDGVLEEVLGLLDAIVF